jgi:DNA-binding NarL/FixJ family response regulator
MTPSRHRRIRTDVAPRHRLEAYSPSQLATMIDIVEIELRVESVRRTVEQTHDALDGIRRELETLAEAVPERAHMNRGRDLLTLLTRQERRVALLAADGLSNIEVAAHIGITGETVRGHMKGVFRKLGIHSRWELAYLLSPHRQAARLPHQPDVRDGDIESPTTARQQRARSGG